MKQLESTQEKSNTHKLIWGSTGTATVGGVKLDRALGLASGSRPSERVKGKIPTSKFGVKYPLHIRKPMVPNYKTRLENIDITRHPGTIVNHRNNHQPLEYHSHRVGKESAGFIITWVL